MPTTSATTPLLEELRSRIARLEQSGGPILEAQTIPFGLAALDGRLAHSSAQIGRPTQNRAICDYSTGIAARSVSARMRSLFWAVKDRRRSLRRSVSEAWA
jgi:hypothetical protein